MANGKQTKSVQVADWVRKREAWSADKPTDPSTKPTRWQFHSGREQFDENIGTIHITGVGDGRTHFDETRRIRSADEHQRRVKIKNSRTTKDDAQLSLNNSRTNLINDRDVYIDDANQEQEDEHHHYHRRKTNRQFRKRCDSEETMQRHQIDDDSIRRHEIDRGSDMDFNTARSSLKNKREFFIKDGNIEILQLMTRDKTRDGAVAAECVAEDDNIYVNLPLKSTNLSHPHYLMVDNSGKEILMRRFIEEQPDGKQIIREHYQIVPGATYIQSMPNEIQQNSTLKRDTFPLSKSGPNSIVYSQTEPEVKVIHTQPVQGSIGTLHVDSFTSQVQPATSNQFLTQELENSLKQQNELLTQELENSLKQQNELLRQILMEKDKMEPRYQQHDLAFETQSLPGQSMAIATQTERDAGTQTEHSIDNLRKSEIGAQGRTSKRRARSENDDSPSEEGDYEYIRLSSPNSPNGIVYCIKRKRPRRRSKYRYGSQPRKNYVMVEEVKRKIRTPIKEEDDEEYYKTRKRPTPKKPPRNNGERKGSVLRRLKDEENRHKHTISSNIELLNPDVLMEISDSLDEKYYSSDRPKGRKYEVEQLELSNSEDDVEYLHRNIEDTYNDSDEKEIVIKNTTFSPIEHKIDSRRPSLNNHNHYEIQVNRTTSGSKSQIRCHSRSSSEQRSDVRPTAKPRLARSDNSYGCNSFQRNTKKKLHTPEPRKSSISIKKYEKSGGDGTKVTTTEFREKSVTQNETVHDEHSSIRSRAESIPKYMQWYYDKKKTSATGRTSTESSTREVRPTRQQIGVRNGSEKRVSKTQVNIKHAENEQPENAKFKPEPAPRKSPPKRGNLLKEDIAKNKQLQPRTVTETSHPLVQHSQHRFERENVPDVPAAHSKLPHFIYPQTPPTISTNKDVNTKNVKPKASPIKENKIKLNKPSRTNLYVEDLIASHPVTSTAVSNLAVQKQLNAATLEDDHDSGIAMNSLLNTMGRRNPIAEKKSVFSIAYDDVSRVQKIASGGESPPY